MEATYQSAWQPQPRQFQIRPYNQRMAKRVARRAHLNEQAVTVAFAFNNLFTAVAVGVVEDIVQFIPTVGELIELVISLLSFYFHRIVIVTDQHVYVFRDWPLHIPGKQLAVYDRAPGVVRLGSDRQGGFSRFIRRGQLTFSDGLVVFHSPIWIRRAQYVAQEGNIPPGM